MALFLHLAISPGGAAEINKRQPTTKELRLSLQQAVDMALKNNRDLQTARRTLSIAASSYRAAKAGYYPKITGTLSASYGSSNQIVTNPWVLYQFATGLNVNLNFPLDLSGAIGRTVQRSLITLIQSKSYYVLAAQSLVVNVNTQYYNLLRYRETLLIDRAQVDQAREQLRIAQARLKAGRVPESDVLTSTVQLDTVRQTLKVDEGQYENAKAQLRNTLVISQNVEIVPTDKLTFTPETVNYDAAVREAEQNRLEIQSARLSIEAAKIALKSAYDPYLPTLGLGGTWGYNTRGRNPDDAFRLQNRPLEPSWTWLASLTVPIFIFDGGVIRESKMQAVTAIEQAEADLHQTKERIDLDVKNQFINLTNAQEQVRIVKDSIKLAQQSVRIAELRYRMGLTGYLETTDVRNNLKTAEVNLLNAIIQANLAKIGLYQAMGRALVTAPTTAEKR
jgi:outer membrane protein TolC